MLLTIASDIHLRVTNPISRSDDYAETTLRKLSQLIRFCNDKGSTLLIPGDLLDKPDLPIWYINKVIDVLNDMNNPIYCIAGNHDLKYHNIENLFESGLWTISAAVDNFYLTHTYQPLSPLVRLHPYPFGVEPDSEPVPDKYNILMLHTPIFEKEVPWFMQDAMTADQLITKYPGFDLYITGDVHVTTITDKVVNTGSMMRSTKAQKEHKPCFVTVDTASGEKEIAYFVIEEDVWKLEFDAPVDDTFSADLDELSQVLLAREEKLCYKDVVVALAGDNDSLKKRLMEIIDGYSERT